MMKALLIEDDDDCRQILSMIAESKGFQTYGLKSWSKSIEEIITLMPHIIFLDERLPSIRGSEICKIIKSVSQLVHVSVYLISATTGLSAVAEQCKAEGYIEKPFDLDDVEAILDKVQNNPRT